jgi:hypothetical protein
MFSALASIGDIARHRRHPPQIERSPDPYVGSWQIVLQKSFAGDVKNSDGRGRVLRVMI